MDDGLQHYHANHTEDECEPRGPHQPHLRFGSARKFGSPMDPLQIIKNPQQQAYPHAQVSNHERLGGRAWDAVLTTYSEVYPAACVLVLRALRLHESYWFGFRLRGICYGS